MGLIGTGYLLASNGDGDTALFAGGIVVLGLVAENIALIPGIWGPRKLKKALNTFNYEMIERHGYQSDTSLSLGITKNGLGFVLQI